MDYGAIPTHWREFKDAPETARMYGPPYKRHVGHQPLTCPYCKGSGCDSCSGSGRLELLGPTMAR